uniref:oxaloacetate tautomerase n=1 Tax=Globodera pallida TaxID=36090 RepID=A0A183BT04_GLOPA
MSATCGRLTKFHEIAQKIICIGRNYKDHALELSNPIPLEPLIFAKTRNAFVLSGGTIKTPIGCSSLHYEVELGVVIGIPASGIRKESAFEHIGGYCIALDMTDRGMQDRLKRDGQPWFLAKSFDTSCPIGEFINKNDIANPHELEIYCAVNERIRQKAKTNAMMFDIPTLLEYITSRVTVNTGDLILTGTPAGVGPCKPGDRIEIGITGITSAAFNVG